MSSSVILDGPRVRAGDAELVPAGCCEVDGAARLDQGAILQASIVGRALELAKMKCEVSHVGLYLGGHGQVGL